MSRDDRRPKQQYTPGVGGAQRRGLRPLRWPLALLPLVLAAALASAPRSQAAPSIPAADTLAAPATSTLTSTLVDLGTLGGASSHVNGVSGQIVIGYSLTTAGFEHAFAYDLGAPNPTMRDLGTLGGETSEATAVDGTLVVGHADLANGSMRAFAYDLAALQPTMKDLGTVGGSTFVEAQAVSGHTVVGDFTLPNDGFRAFAIDLSAPNPIMRDLGTLGGHGSVARAVDGTVVVGDADKANGTPHAFACDLAAATQRMRDLGTLGGNQSGATRIDGDIVVGTSSIARSLDDDPNSAHGFSYDLAAASPKMRDLGTLGGSGSHPADISGTLVTGFADGRTLETGYAFVEDLSDPSPTMRSLGNLGGTWAAGTGVSGTIVVGHASRPDGHTRAFAYDLGSATPKMTDLGSRPGTWSEADAVDGNVVAGITVNPDTEMARAAAWKLSQTTGPVVEFSRFHTTVAENESTARITIVRQGDTGPAVSVHYTTQSLTAEAGRDFTTTSGTLSFAAGETDKSFTLPILNDTAAEPRERMLLTLSSPTGGAVLGTPNAAGLDIVASDQQPDALISTRRASRYIGNNLYNSTGAQQSKSRPVRRGHARTFYVRVQNDGNITNTFTLKGSAAQAGTTVQYYSGLRNVSVAMLSISGTSLTLRPHTTGQLRIRIKAGAHAVRGSRAAAVHVFWTGDGARSDLVRASVRVRR